MKKIFKIFLIVFLSLAFLFVIIFIYITITESLLIACQSMATYFATILGSFTILTTIYSITLNSLFKHYDVLEKIYKMNKTFLDIAGNDINPDTKQYIIDCRDQCVEDLGKIDNIAKDIHKLIHSIL